MKVALLYLLFTSLLSACNSSPSSNHSRKLQLSLEAHQAATHHEEWESSYLRPERVFSEFRKLEISENEKNQICDYLNSLADSDLTLFETEIRREENTELVESCREKLKSALERYWDDKQMGLYARYSGLLKSEVKKQTDQGEGHISPYLNRLFLNEANFTIPVEEDVLPIKGGEEFFYGNLKEKEIAITFDDGPHVSLTLKLLDILQRTGVRATFFTVGKNVRAYTSITKEVAHRGHSFGSHSWDHAELTKLSSSKAKAQVVDGHREMVKVVFDITGIEFPFFRFPYGARNKGLKKQLAKVGLASFMWNMDTLDWKIKDPTKLLDYALEQVENEKRGIILFHDVQKQTIEMMSYFLYEIYRKGYTLIVFLPG